MRQVIYTAPSTHIMSFNNNSPGPTTFNGTFNNVAGNQDNSQHTHNDNSTEIGKYRK